MAKFEFIQEISELTEVQTRTDQFSIYFWIVLFIALTGIAVIRATNQTYFTSLFKVAIFNRNLNQQIQEDLKFGNIGPILLQISYFGLLALLVGQFNRELDQTHLLTISLILIGAMVIKWFIMFLLSIVVRTNAGILDHFYNHLVYSQVAVILLVPYLLVSEYTELQSYLVIHLVIIGLLVFIIILREIQSVLRGLRSKVAAIYIILYLCTLELLPLLVVIRIFISKNY